MKKICLCSAVNGRVILWAFEVKNWSFVQENPIVKVYGNAFALKIKEGSYKVRILQPDLELGVIGYYGLASFNDTPFALNRTLKQDFVKGKWYKHLQVLEGGEKGMPVGPFAAKNNKI